MPLFLKIRLDEEQIPDAFRARLASVPLQPLYRSIGEFLLLRTDERFQAEKAPDGTPWAPLSPATLAQKSTDKILQESGTRGGLRGSIAYDATDERLRVGTNKVYGRVHQRGIGRRSFVETRRSFAAIPARPYLGTSKRDRAIILEDVAAYFQRRAQG